jgi:hypothetical protein
MILVKHRDIANSLEPIVHDIPVRPIFNASIFRLLPHQVLWKAEPTVMPVYDFKYGASSA